MKDRRDFLRSLALFGGAGTLPLLGAPAPAAEGRGVYDVRDFGARGDGATNDAPAIQAAIDRCARAGGGTVLVPAGGRFLTGTLELRSHVHFRVDAGAELLASLEPAHYREGALILARGARDLTLSGRGTIHGQGRRFMREELPHIFRPGPWRPRLLMLERCVNLRLRDLTLREAPFWTLHLAGCEDVAIYGLSILNDRKIPNCDGIGVDSSRNVRISDCHIEAGDDCIVLKTLREHPAGYGPCENVTVRGCTLASTSAALKIGTETVRDIRDVVFSGCVVRDSSRGLAIQLRDEGTVENVLFSDLIVETRYPDADWWGAAEPIHLSALPRREGARVGRIRDVRFSNVLCRSENGVVLHGSPESVPEGIVLERVKVRIEKWTEFAGGKLDLRPSAAGLTDRPTAGIYGEALRDLSLLRCAVEWEGAPPPYSRYALELRSVAGLEKVGFRGRSAAPGRFPDELIG